jgi:gamma-glutamyl hercynylcysteine S-oxide synthase
VRRDSNATAATIRGSGATARTTAGAATAPALATTTQAWISLDDPEMQRLAFAYSIAAGLSARPRRVSARYLYDERGSELFDQITRTPEYYLTRAETEILARYAREIRSLAGASTLVELGSGTAAKTRLLLEAWCARGRATYVPVDICHQVLEQSCAALSEEFPRLEVRGMASSYEQAILRLGELSPVTLAFLGSTIGNFDDDELDGFFELVATSLSSGDTVLLGLDLAKDPAVLEAAYDDAAGVTAAFTRNLFERMNRELGVGLDLATIDHVARYDEVLERIEIHAHFREGATIALPTVGRSFRLSPGEMVRTEISRKFRPDDVVARVADYGFEPVRCFLDADERFALLLLRLERSPRDTAAVRRRLRRACDAARARTLELVAPLTEEQLRRQHSPLMSPIAWDLAHIANFSEQWASAACPELRRTPSGSREHDNLYDALAHPRSTRGSLPLLDSARGRAYLDEARKLAELALARLDLDSGDPLHRDGYVFAMLDQHEAQHGETILQTIRLVPNLEYEPPWRSDPPRASRRLEETRVLVPAGTFVIGTDDRAVAYDNERPAHLVELPSFAIDVAPVSNGRFLEFMGDGGYRRRELWTEEGWEWLREASVSHPGSWERTRTGAWHERRFGRRDPLDPSRPVVHVSWFEADAFARWAGVRLPTEFEWEKAAACDLERGIGRRYPWGNLAPTAAHANLDQRCFGPAQIGAYPEGRSFFGCEHLIGDVWEWTASEFLPYPGFRSFPYEGYSAVHFARGYRVLRGGSWATRSVAIRNTFRNWDLPARRQIFAGFRCAADV